MMLKPVYYSRRKLGWMALLCGIGLPVISPVMLATGPGAVILIPLLVIGGPICAVACLVRMMGNHAAVEYGVGQVKLRTLWRTIEFSPYDVVGVRADYDTVTWHTIIPISRKWHLFFDLAVRANKIRTVKLPLNLLDMDVTKAKAYAVEAMHNRPNIPTGLGGVLR
jgi:hypothetical protein